MKKLLNRGKRVTHDLWRADRPLTATGLVMLAALVLSLAGLAADPRLIVGAPAWLKPAKFAASIAIFTFTLAWVFRYLPGWPKTRRWVGFITAVTLNLEFVIIALQAWRGTTSHFNVGTRLDGVLWIVMGAAIVVQTFSTVAVAFALWRQSFTDASLGWALRLGVLISLLGASVGGLMTRPTAAQLEEARTAGRMTVVGAHTVGAPDGGPGLPGTNWSLEHGDLRVAHFAGLHAMQALPLIALLFRRRSETTRFRMSIVAGVSYALLFSVLLFQALRGQSVVDPDASTIGALAGWAVLTALAARAALSRRSPVPARAV